MATGSTLTTLDAILKENYSHSQVESLVYKRNPALALIKKREDAGGRRIIVPVKYADPQARSATFSNAQTRSTATSSSLIDFQVTRVQDYSLATIANEVILATKGDANSFVNAVSQEVDGAINQLTRSLAISLYRSGTGSIGQISTSSFTTKTLTLVNASDITNFEVGQELMVSATDGGATRTVGSSGVGLVVTGIDRDAGTLLFGYNVNDSTNGITAIAQNDYLSIRGDLNKKLSGFEAWCPATAPGSSDSFFGVNRSADAVRLAGKRYDATGTPILEALIEGASRVAREGGAPDTAFMSYAKFAALEKALQSSVRYQDVKEKTTKVSFNSIVVRGPNGDINVIPDQNCPDNRCFLLQLDTWSLDSLGKAVSCISADGLQMIRQASDDGFEVRYAFYGNLVCDRPGFNMNIKW